MVGWVNFPIPNFFFFPGDRSLHGTKSVGCNPWDDNAYHDLWLPGTQSMPQTFFWEEFYKSGGCGTVNSVVTVVVNQAIWRGTGKPNHTGWSVSETKKNVCVTLTGSCPLPWIIHIWLTRTEDVRISYLLCLDYPSWTSCYRNQVVGRIDNQYCLVDYNSAS